MLLVLFAESGLEGKLRVEHTERRVRPRPKRGSAKQSLLHGGVGFYFSVVQ